MWCGRDPERRPDKVEAPTKSGQAGGTGGVDALRIGRLKKRRSTVDSQESKGTEEEHQSTNERENDGIGRQVSNNILPHDYGRCQGKVVSANV